MDKPSINERNIGVNFGPDGAARILLWAPKAGNVAIRIAENEDVILEKQGRGYWQLTTDRLKPGMSYQVVLDDNVWPDITALRQPEVHAASQAFDLNEFVWKDQEWQNISLLNYIIYELHTGTYSEEGTFDGIAKKLDHLKSLGITAIELMPVAQFPGARNWGYDGVFPFAVQESYGGPWGLQRLVNACHEKGLAVILDVVYNHLGPEGNYLGQYGPFFTEKYKTPWGNALNFDDGGCDGVRRFFIENALMWLRDFHIDALRMDESDTYREKLVTTRSHEVRL